MTVTGTVTDQSPSGRHNINGDLDFTLKGTPAISDNSMDAWMEYMFHQRPKPTDAQGVEVSLDTIDPNGNLVPIGKAITDTNGNFGLVYTPKVPGTYQIIATFAGSNSYGPSDATTYLTVGDEAPATIEPTEAPLSIADTYFVPAIAGLFLTIIITSVLLAVLFLKKRP